MRLSLSLMYSKMRYLAPIVLLVACAAPQGPVAPSPIPAAPQRAEGPAVPDTASVGVLVMAHGGSDAWNAAVLKAVQPLADMVPTEVAFGMADPLALAGAIATLEQVGVRRVAVVRMFLSGESFIEQTRYLLGLSESRPQHFLLMGEARRLGPTPKPVVHHSEVATHEEGIMLSPEAAKIVTSRALQLSGDPAVESVLLLAHGMGDEAANERVVQAMEHAAGKIVERGFAAVEVETLREDWAEEREGAEVRIRAFVAAQSSMDRRVIVVPYRLSGFGPYAEVLAGVEYTPTEGLLPDPRLSDWIARTASQIVCAQGWESNIASCAATDATPHPHSR